MSDSRRGSKEIEGKELSEPNVALEAEKIENDMKPDVVEDVEENQQDEDGNPLPENQAGLEIVSSSESKAGI